MSAFASSIVRDGASAASSARAAFTLSRRVAVAFDYRLALRNEVAARASDQLQFRRERVANGDHGQQRQRQAASQRPADEMRRTLTIRPGA